jgi:TRAP-type mannitol/chloroaromatic compound transport system substrate-binding protein
MMRPAAQHTTRGECHVGAEPQTQIRCDVVRREPAKVPEECGGRRRRAERDDTRGLRQRRAGRRSPEASRAAAPQPSVTLRLQAGNPAGDFFFELARDYARIVSDLSAGTLKIDILPAGAVVKAFDMADAVHKGTLDMCYAVPAFWYGKDSALSLFGTGPALGHNANTLLSWYEHGGGKALSKSCTARC